MCECPDGLRSYFLPDNYGICGLWRYIDDNTCDGQSTRRNCTSRGNCIQDAVNCTSDICDTGTEMQGQCGKFMKYECEHTCTRITNLYGCVDTCTVHPVHSDNTSVVCLANSALTLNQTIQYQTDCKQEGDTLNDSKETTSKTVVTVGVAVSVALAILGVLLLVIYRKKRSKKRKAGEKNQPGTELLNMSNIPEENTSTEPEISVLILIESVSEIKVAETSDQLMNVLLQPEHKAHYRQVYNSI